MRHNYGRILAYDPVEDRVTVYKSLGEEYIFEEKKLDEVFYEVLAKTNRINELVLGFTLTNDMYQLSPAAYGTYVKEDYWSAVKLNRGKILAAISRYKKEHHLKFEEY